tara:strand:- start:48673 stop:51789 length:3117 start_codon:yes stop_codon:yes gene_type:complete
MKVDCIVLIRLLAILVIAPVAVLGDEPDDVIAFETLDYPLGSLYQADAGGGWKGAWRTSRVGMPSIAEFPESSVSPPRVSPTGADVSPTGADVPLPSSRGVLIKGTGARNNPLRREIETPLTQPEVFVRFDLHYLAPESENTKEIDPEFFVLWLDRLEGGDRSTHSANVPNIGVHQADRGPKQGRNVFMVRIGGGQTAWSNVELQYNRTYQVVGRLKKTSEGQRADFDRFDLWVNPNNSDLASPDATVSGVQSISMVQWIGASTGLKTEATDQILIRNLVLGHSWNSVLDTPAAQSVATAPHRFNGIVWDKPVDFKREIFPLLQSQCFDCHAGENPDSGYRLDVYRELLGYSTGEVLAEPGRSQHSRLIKVLAAESADERMPPDGVEPLSDSQIAMFCAWIDQGMKWDDALLPPPKRESDHWAFQPITRPPIPAVECTDWVKTPVDAFVARAHQDAGLEHAAEASTATLVRRLYLDLIGLPPTTEELEAVLGDTSPKAIDDLVERLLDSPHYGERWGRYWLDLARWAESQGYQHDIVRPYAWRYRDYVIDAFNDDKPYDRFLKEQLAGDELHPYRDENLIATGFLGAARISGNQEDESIQRNDVLVDIVNATGSAILGLTMECAQCHNHKFDPVSQRDYYRLQAFFVRGQLGNLSLRDPDVYHPTDLAQWIPKPAFAFYTKEVKTLLRKKMYAPSDQPHTWGFLSAATGDSGIQRLPVVNRKPIQWRPSALKDARARMLIRGDAGSPGHEVQPGWPEVLGRTPISLGEKPRSELADWMSDPANPLVARVWVNRLWQYHFGSGIVATASDFGVEGAEPTHPELLDWLASELIENDWSTKSIHRLIVHSSTYRQQRKFHSRNASLDPNNQLLWNWPRRRLEAEAIRDSVLVATGELERKVGGVSVPPEREEQDPRRTIYLFQQRSGMPSVMEMFDAPEGIASCSRRAVSTVALQPLFMLNSQFMARRADALANAVIKEAGDDVSMQIDVAFRRTLSRLPDDRERELAERILKSAGHDSSVSSLMQFCHALLNLNEFVYIP